MVTNVTISDVTWDSFLLSWFAEDGAFEAFLITVTDAETGAEWQNHTVPADARSLAITSLYPTTWYRAIVYGVYRGAPLDPVIAETITGINAINSGPSHFPMISSLSNRHSPVISPSLCEFSRLLCSALPLIVAITNRCYTNTCSCAFFTPLDLFLDMLKNVSDYKEFIFINL